MGPGAEDSLLACIIRVLLLFYLHGLQGLHRHHHWLWDVDIPVGGCCRRCGVGNSDPQFLEHQRGDIHTRQRIDEGALVAVGVEHQAVALLHTHLQNGLLQFLVHLGQQVLLGLFQQLTHLDAE